MTPAEIEVKIAVAQREVDFWRGILERKGCKTCSHWHYGCELAEFAMPPEEVVKTGCPSYVWDTIPF